MAALPSRVRVLVVDDSASFRRLIARVLAAEGYAVEEASNAEKGLALALDRVPDVLVLDWCLRGGSGLAVLRALRRRTQTVALPVILVSALRQSAEDEAEALQAGASLFLDKTELAHSLSGFARHVRALAQSRRTLALLELGGGFSLDLATGVLSGPGHRRRLNPQERRLLELLHRSHGRLLPHERLWSEVWDSESERWRHLLSNRVSSLRRKLGPLAPRLVCRRDEGFLLEPA